MPTTTATTTEWLTPTTSDTNCGAADGRVPESGGAVEEQEEPQPSSCGASKNEAHSPGEEQGPSKRRHPSGGSRDMYTNIQNKDTER